MTNSDVQSILLEHYSFKKILQLTLLKGGVSNDNYVFSDGDQEYVARVCLFEPENQISSLIPFLEYSEITEYSAPRLVQTNDSRNYVGNDSTPIVVTKYLKGDPGDSVSIEAQHLRSLAKLVANFHNLKYVPQNTAITLDPDYILDLYERLGNYRPADKDAESLRLIELVDIYYKKFKGAKFTDFVKNLSHGIAHGDINLGNVLFDGEEAVSLLDFEEIA